MYHNSANHKGLPGPDFLCIGMQKAGTGFFYECLQNLSSFRLPLGKEIHHFDKPGQVHPGGPRLLKKFAVKLNLDADSPAELQQAFDRYRLPLLGKEKFKLAGKKFVLDRTYLEFLRKFCVYVNSGADDQAYLDLFTPYRKFLSGDVTPAYSTLDSDAIKRLHALMPEVRIILCVRDPVARLWSQLNMQVRREFKLEHDRLPDAGDVDEFNRLLDRRPLQNLANQKNFMSRSMATQVHQRWVDEFGEDRLLVINFEDLTRKTEQVLDKTAVFLGAKPQKSVVIPGNKKESALKTVLDDNRREALREVLGAEVEAYSRLFDNHRDRV